MKLYTEEDLIHICLFISEYHNYNEEEVKELIKHLHLTPIELPSDEDIEKVANKTFDQNNNGKILWKDGIKWMKEQIFNQNK